MYVTVRNKISVATYGYIMSVLCNFLFIYFFQEGMMAQQIVLCSLGLWTSSE